MVKLGFIVEGDTEKIILETTGFKSLLQSFCIEYVPEIINANGNGNLLPNNIEKFIQILENKGANKIIVLADLDNDKCVSLTKERIQLNKEHICIVSKKTIEAWFLADDDAMSNFLKNNFHCPDPKEIQMPFDYIVSLRKQFLNKGIGNKLTLASYMTKSNFSIERAAKHPNCSSASYFLNKLKSLSNSIQAASRLNLEATEKKIS